MNNLIVVIHTEEEFNWNLGFNKNNNEVNHVEDLIFFCDMILDTGAKIIFAMDYAFINSDRSELLIKYYKNNKLNVEFGAHLHPWVNPPFLEPFNEDNSIHEYYSFPGNLAYETEKQKLVTLTALITTKTGEKPKSYLAGRYGIGPNTYKILEELEYTTDYSISPFADFSLSGGPNFSLFTNKELKINNILCIPHTSGYICLFDTLSKFFNSNPKIFNKINNNFFGKILLKILNFKRVRLSTEGYSYKEMKKLINSIDQSTISTLVFSFHSPTVKLGLTPYVQTQEQLSVFKKNTIDFLESISLNKSKKRRV